MTGNTPLDTFRHVQPAERHLLAGQAVMSVEQLALKLAEDPEWLSAQAILPPAETRILTALSRDMRARADLLLPRPKAAIVADVVFGLVLLGAVMGLFLALMMLSATS